MLITIKPQKVDISPAQKVIKFFKAGVVTVYTPVPVDEALDADSENPVQNKAIATKFSEIEGDISTNTENISTNTEAINTINGEVEDLQGRVITSIDYMAETGYLVEGSVTSGTINSLTDSSATWLRDQWAGKVVKTIRNGGADYCYAIVLSNTTDTLTFDDDLIVTPCAECTYKIMETYNLEVLNSILALNVTDYPMAVTLPASTPENERYYAHIYLERAGNGDTEIPIMCKGADRMAGAKYGTLNAIQEGVRIYAHQWLSNHWDIISTYNIKRFAAGRWATTDSIGTTWDYMGNCTFDFYRRFRPVVIEGNTWVRYTSLFQRWFYASFIAVINKTGGVGDCDITVAVKDGVTGVITIYEEWASATRFGAGTGETTISCEVPVLLSRNDEVIAVARHSGGTFTLGIGSSLKLIEF
jgi:hypothetical protein